METKWSFRINANRVSVKHVHNLFGDVSTV